MVLDTLLPKTYFDLTLNSRDEIMTIAASAAAVCHLRAEGEVNSRRKGEKKGETH